MGKRRLVEYASYVSEEISVDNFKLLLEAGNKSEKRELKASRISYDKAINLGIQLLRKNRADLASAYQGRMHMAGAHAQAV